MERKLTAILCADVFGYSRLMGDDEEATLRTLSSHRKLIDSLIEQHRGRFVNSAGDSVLAEFASVVNAVQCAVEIQTTLKAENANLPPERWMEFRIGVNLGDVMVEGEQIYGDGVNVAARLESLADPGGICISRTVHENIRNKLPLGYEDLGDQTIKNIAEPVRVFRVLAAGVSTTRKTRRVPREYVRRGVFSAASLVIITAIVVLVQHLSLRPPTTTASIPQPQKPALPFPNVPSIAVLPFANLSGERDQEYFSDGITNDLITSLSRSLGLFVIDRASTFTYKGKPVKVQDVSRELGVKYVLEGGVQKAGEQVRISAQLVDATTGTELWAEHYDRPMTDIFALQDEIVRRIVTTMGLQLRLWEQYGVLLRKRTDNLEAYDDLLRATEYGRPLTKQGNEKSREMCEKAIELDPKYADAYACLAWSYFYDYEWQWSQDPHALDRGVDAAQHAIALDDSQAYAHAVLGRLYIFKRQYDQAIEEGRRTTEIAPNYAYGYDQYADMLSFSGRPAEAVRLGLTEKAMRLDPRNRNVYIVSLGIAYAFMGRYEKAIPLLKACIASVPNNLGARIVLAYAYSESGDIEQARAEVAEVQRISPKFSLEKFGERFSLKDQALSDRMSADLRRASLK